GEARTHTKVEAVVVARIRGVEAAKLLPHVPSHQHAYGAYAEHVLQVVVLLLVELLAAQQPARASLREALPQLDDALGVIPVNKLRARHRDRGCALHARENAFERFR